MKTQTLAFLLACNILLLGGCAIKEDDTTSEKFIKHTVNTPAYVILGAGAIASEGSKAALTAILVPPYAAYKHLTKDTNDTDCNATDSILEK